MCGDRWHNTIILRKRKGATDTDTLVSRVQRVCRSVQIRSSGASECAGVVFESVGIWSRECERSSRISSGRLLCMDYLFQYWIVGDFFAGTWSKVTDQLIQISDIFVLSLLHFPGTPRQLNHSGTLTIKLIGLNVIFCPLKMDEMLGRSVKGRNCVNNRSTPSRTCDLDQTWNKTWIFSTFLVRGMLSNKSSRPDKFFVNYCSIILNIKCGENLCHCEFLSMSVCCWVSDRVTEVWYLFARGVSNKNFLL